MKVNEIITQKIIDELEKGTVPWQKPWTEVGMPKNLISKKFYQGINVLLLILAHYPSPWWVTYKQAKDLGGQVKKGEHSWIAVFYKTLEVPDMELDSNNLVKSIPFLRYYNIFNTTQCEGFEDKIPKIQAPPANLNPLDSCEKIIEGYKDRPEVMSHDKACYYPAKDAIGMPPKDLFKSMENYYAALFHECVHSTGHSKRLDRSGINDCSPFGSENYSQEELVAEIGSVFLYSLVGIDQVFTNSISYIKTWIDRLKGNANLIIQSSSQAQKAYNHILGCLPENGGDPN